MIRQRTYNSVFDMSTALIRDRRGWQKASDSLPKAEAQVWFVDGTERVCHVHEYQKPPGTDRHPRGVWAFEEGGLNKTRPLSEGPFWRAA